MNYSLFDINTNLYISEFIHDIYHLYSEKECVYTTAPNGVIGLSIITSGEAYIYCKNKWSELPKIHVYGLIDKPFALKTSSNYNEICIGFTPYNFQLFHKIKMSYLTCGNVTDAYNVFNKYSLDELANKLANKKDVYSSINEFLSKEFIRQKENHVFKKILFEIENGQINSVSHLSQNAGFSATHLRSYFRENAGLSPKQLIRIKRINRILKSEKHGFKNLTELGLYYDYYDQAHFTNDFKSVMGMCPNKYFKSPQLVKDFHSLNRWQNDPFSLVNNA